MGEGSGCDVCSSVCSGRGVMCSGRGVMCSGRGVMCSGRGVMCSGVWLVQRIHHKASNYEGNETGDTFARRVKVTPIQSMPDMLATVQGIHVNVPLACTRIHTYMQVCHLHPP